MGNKKTKAIAFYLPQFYPTPENDEWWAPGFTEWTNVARAKPLFKGHYQPRIPGELSFYDLRLPSVRERQAELAREAGIYGFCYWHYWFGNGKRLLSDVFKEVVETGKPDFPFCLCWANHSWYQKTWDPTKPAKLLMEQTYPGVEDYKAHFYEMLPAFKDERYIKVNGKLLFGVFDAYKIPDKKLFFETWNELAKDNGLDGFSFFAFVQGSGDLAKIDRDEYDLIVFDAYFNATSYEYNKKGLRGFFNKIKRKIFSLPVVVDYLDYVNIAVSFFKNNPNIIPCIDPDFDHTPRSGNKTALLHNSSPQKWGGLVKQIKSLIDNGYSFDNIIFIKAWNEWGEGNYLEPDMRFGKAYIEETAKALNGVLPQPKIEDAGAVD